MSTDIRENDTLSTMGHRMLQYTEPGGLLTTREKGESALSDLERAIRAQQPGAVIVIDFERVKAISAPFADAFLGKLLAGRVAGYYEDHPIVLVNANEDLRETIGLALRYRHLVALALGDGRPALLGADPVLDQTLQAAFDLEPFSVVDLATRLRLTPQATNNRLRQLLRSGALERERVNPARGGREFRYRIPVPA